MNRHPMHYASVEPGGCLCPDCRRAKPTDTRIDARRKALAVLDTIPTGRDEELTHDMWEPAWIETLEACTAFVPKMSREELARTLCWAHRHSCYYHSELCDLLTACVAEAAHWLRGEKTR